MSHTSVDITFADSTSPGTDINVDIAEMTDPSGYPNHANTPQV